MLPNHIRRYIGKPTSNKLKTYNLTARQVNTVHYSLWLSSTGLEIFLHLIYHEGLAVDPRYADLYSVNYILCALLCLEVLASAGVGHVIVLHPPLKNMISCTACLL